MKILLIEDDQQLGMSISEYLKIKGHSYEWAKSLEEAYSVIEDSEFDLFIVDWMLPDGEGKDFIKDLRDSGDTTPMIMLTARREIKDKVEGLNSGSDDYLTKPFDFEELNARMNALFRRRSVAPKKCLEIDDMTLSVENKILTIAGECKTLSSTETYILEILFNHQGAFVSKSEIENKLRNSRRDVGYNAIEAHISRIRNKIGTDKIKTLRGVGYKIG